MELSVVFTKNGKTRDESLHNIANFQRVAFEQVPIYQLLTDTSLQTFDYDSRKQLKLFDL